MNNDLLQKYLIPSEKTEEGVNYSELSHNDIFYLIQFKASAASIRKKIEPHRYLEIVNIIISYLDAHKED